jgi:hypothetical protein
MIWGLDWKNPVGAKAFWGVLASRPHPFKN